MTVDAFYSWVRRRRGIAAAGAFRAVNVAGAVSRLAIYLLMAPFNARVRHVKLPDAWRWLSLNLNLLRRRPH